MPKLTTAFTSSTAALPEETSKKFKESTGRTISDNFGMSEAGGVTHSNLAVSDLVEKKKPGSIGVPMPDTEVKIIDLETGNEAADGKEGELWIKGPQIMKGYWPTPGSGLINGWLPSGDVVRMDEDGYFYITDRIKDMVNVSGMKVYTILVDEVLQQHPAVVEGAAIGIPDAERPGSERVKAFIVLKNEYEGKVTPEEIIGFCKERLAPYEVPKYVEFIKELPRSPVGKVLKRQLRDASITKPN
jgi:long-chain acyl-CoA synthetase